MYNRQVKIHFVPQTCRLSSVGLGLGRLLARRQGADDGANFEEQVVGGLRFPSLLCLSFIAGFYHPKRVRNVPVNNVGGNISKILPDL